VTPALLVHPVSPVRLVNLATPAPLEIPAILEFPEQQALRVKAARKVTLVFKAYLAPQVPGAPLARLALTRQWAHL
jgi:hypothetical protein